MKRKRVDEASPRKKIKKKDKELKCLLQPSSDLSFFSSLPITMVKSSEDIIQATHGRQKLAKESRNFPDTLDCWPSSFNFDKNKNDTDGCVKQAWPREKNNSNKKVKRKIEVLGVAHSGSGLHRWVEESEEIIYNFNILLKAYAFDEYDAMMLGEINSFIEEFISQSGLLSSKEHHFNDRQKKWGNFFDLHYRFLQYMYNNHQEINDVEIYYDELFGFQEKFKSIYATRSELDDEEPVRLAVEKCYSKLQKEISSTKDQLGTITKALAFLTSAYKNFDQLKHFYKIKFPNLKAEFREWILGQLDEYGKSAEKHDCQTLSFQ